MWLFVDADEEAGISGLAPYTCCRGLADGLWDTDAYQPFSTPCHQSRRGRRYLIEALRSRSGAAAATHVRQKDLTLLSQ